MFLKHNDNFYPNNVWGGFFNLFFDFDFIYLGEGSISEHMTMKLVLRFWMMVSEFVCIYAHTCGE